jgi:hypothetical protein
MPKIRDHPTWWVRYSQDGLRVHKWSLLAQKIFLEHKIANCIEEADSSHVNQPFDRSVAQRGRATMKNALQIVKASNVIGKMLSQSELIVAALAGLRYIGGLIIDHPIDIVDLKLQGYEYGSRESR